MPAITVRVTAGPRWCEEENRYQNNGELIRIAADTEAELLEKWAFYEVHCTELVEGELPAPAPGLPAPKVRRHDPDRERILAAVAEKRKERAVDDRIYFKASPPDEPKKKRERRSSAGDVRIARS